MKLTRGMTASCAADTEEHIREAEQRIGVVLYIEQESLEVVVW